MVGVLILAAQGTLTSRQLYELLTIPSQRNFAMQPAPAHGLYLVNVAYDNDALNRMTVDLSPRERTRSNDEYKTLKNE